MEMDIRKLKEAALAVRENAYVPYSQFKVGAALMDSNGHIHAGCNVENAAYGPTNCAERTALFRAMADGLTVGSFQMMAVVADLEGPVSPCGVCRQVLIELCPPDMPVFMGNLQGEWIQSTVSQLLPGAFGPKSLER
jgi:cytidine deaminase